MNAPMRTLIEDLVLAIGPDVEYVRPEGDRVYLTGVEIAFVIAVGLLSRFLEGYLDGLVKKPGEQLGERHRERVLQGLRKVGDGVLRRHSDDTDTAVVAAEAAGEQLQLLLPGVLEIAQAGGGLDVPAARASAQAAVMRELVSLGFPADSAERHAKRITRQVDETKVHHVVGSLRGTG